MLTFSINKSSLDDIFTHLHNTSDLHKPSLASRVDLAEFSQKIYTNAVRFEMWDNDKLVSLLSCYLNCEDKKSGFINNVSTLACYLRQGLASSLLIKCIEYAKQKSFNDICLEVNKNNNKAIALYERYSFNSCHNNANDEYIKMCLYLV